MLNFIEVISDEEVKDVKLRNGDALVTMANDITGKSSSPYSYSRYWLELACNVMEAHADGAICI